MAANPSPALAGLAALLDHSSRTYQAQGASTKAQHLEGIASNTAARISALAVLHPQIQLSTEQLIPQAATALHKGTLRN